MCAHSRLACGRRRAGARAEERPAQEAVVGFEKRGGGVTCERPRLSSAASRSSVLRGAAGPHPGRPRRGSGQSPRPRRGLGGVGPWLPPRSAPGRVGETWVGCPPASGGLGEEKRNFPALFPAVPGPSAARGGVVVAGGSCRRHVGVCEKRGAPGPLPLR